MDLEIYQCFKKINLYYQKPNHDLYDIVRHALNTGTVSGHEKIASVMNRRHVIEKNYKYHKELFEILDDIVSIEHGEYYSQHLDDSDNESDNDSNVNDSETDSGSDDDSDSIVSNSDDSDTDSDDDYKPNMHKVTKKDKKYNLRSSAKAISNCLNDSYYNLIKVSYNKFNQLMNQVSYSTHHAPNDNDLKKFSIVMEEIKKKLYTNPNKLNEFLKSINNLSKNDLNHIVNTYNILKCKTTYLKEICEVYSELVKYLDGYIDCVNMTSQKRNN